MINGRQIHAARALLGWTQQELADKALISRNAINRIENAKSDALTSTIDAMLRVFAKAGIQFTSEDGYEGVRLRKRKRGAEAVGSTRRVIEEAIERGHKHKAALLRKAGGPLSAEQAANMLRITIGELERSKVLLAVRLENGELAWPAFQFESQAMIDGVEKALLAVNVDEPWAKLNFFFLRLQELGGKTAVQAIREGSLEAVVRAASHFGDHGAS